MAQVTNRRLAMTLFSSDACPRCHMVRIVLAEKGINYDVQPVDLNDTPEDLKDLNPYNEVPTLVDRDLVLYQHQVIMEYLDERFPHPPLMPVDPVSRARSRIMLYRIDRDWYSVLDDITSDDTARAEKGKKTIRDGLTVIAPIFVKKPYFMSDEFTLVDASLAPLLWRLSYYGITLPDQAKPVYQYAERLFGRDAFRTSLSEFEKEISH